MLVALADPSWSPLPVSEVVVCVAVVRHQSLAGIHKKGRRIYNKNCANVPRGDRGQL